MVTQKETLSFPVTMVLHRNYHITENDMKLSKISEPNQLQYSGKRKPFQIT